MSLDSFLEIVTLSVVVPAIVALGVAWLCRRFPFDGVLPRYSAALGFAAGFIVGYVLLPDWAAIVPDRHWHWLPILAGAAAVTGSISRAKGVALPERWLLALILSAIAAWFLVPTWSSLSPLRAVWLSALAGQLCLLIILIDPLPQRVGDRAVLWSLCLTSLVVVVTIAACVSLTYARVAGVASGALIGVNLACWRRSSDMAVSSLVPTAMVTVGGIAFVGCIEPQSPLMSLLLLPAAPAALWLRSVGPLGRLTGIRAMAAEAAIVIVPLMLAAWYAYHAT